ncbi:MAG: hypothetical protein AAF491_12185, partial [Verrucomicrobiota bacterium]
TSVSWTDFPLANEVVEMVPVFPENAVPMNAKVETYSSSEAKGLEIVFRVGLRDESDWDEIRYEGPLVTFRANRHIPLPQGKIVGKEIYLEYLSDGSLFAITLQAISVTHVRKSASNDKLEIRGLLDGEGIAHIHGLSPAAQKDAVEAAGFVALLPDKLALSDWNDTELMFRDLRLVKDYGITIQSTAAGPGMLELEGLSLDGPVEENPWLFLRGESRRDMVPENQRTGEAG